MDELCHTAGADPVGFRPSHLNDPRAKDVIDTVAKLASLQLARAKGQAIWVNDEAAVMGDVDVRNANRSICVITLTSAISKGITPFARVEKGYTVPVPGIPGWLFSIVAVIAGQTNQFA